MTVERLTPTLYCVTERLPRRLEREHYVVHRGGDFTDDQTGKRVPPRIARAITAAVGVL